MLTVLLEVAWRTTTHVQPWFRGWTRSLRNLISSASKRTRSERSSLSWNCRQRDGRRIGGIAREIAGDEAVQTFNIAAKDTKSQCVQRYRQRHTYRANVSFQICSGVRQSPKAFIRYKLERCAANDWTLLCKIFWSVFRHLGNAKKLLILFYNTHSPLWTLKLVESRLWLQQADKHLWKSRARRKWPRCVICHGMKVKRILQLDMEVPALLNSGKGCCLYGRPKSKQAKQVISTRSGVSTLDFSSLRQNLLQSAFMMGVF